MLNISSKLTTLCNEIAHEEKKREKKGEGKKKSFLQKCIYLSYALAEKNLTCWICSTETEGRSSESIMKENQKSAHN